MIWSELRQAGRGLSLKLVQPGRTSTEQLTAGNDLVRPREGEVRLGMKAGAFHFQMAGSHWHMTEDITMQPADY